MSRVLGFLIVASVLAGCLEPGPPPEGRRLSAERDVKEDIRIFEVSGEPWVEFWSIRKKATPPLKAVVDLHHISWDGTRHHVVTNLKDRSLGSDGNSVWGLVDEQPVEDEVERRYGNLTVATLVRIGGGLEIDKRIPNVSSYQAESGRLVYRTVAQGGEPAAWHLWDGTTDRKIMPAPASTVISMDIRPSGAIYIRSSDDQVLRRLLTPDGQIEKVRDNVSRYLLRDDDEWMAVADTESGKTKALLVNLETGVELPLARPNPCCWTRFDDSDHFLYVQAALDDNPAESHVFDLTTGEDDGTLMPDNLVDVSAALDRKATDEDLYLDSQGHGAFLGRNDMQLRRKVSQRLTWPFFSPDGRYLLYVDQVPPTAIETVAHGPLMAQDAELTSQPRRISPPGLDIPLDPTSGQPFFMLDGDKQVLVFWARFGHNTSDLYFADVETGQLRLVAQSIRNVSVAPDGYFGIVNVSQQDLVGDLVLKDLVHDKTRVLSQAVAAFRRNGDDVAFAVRGRVPSDHDGVWVTSLKPAPADGGAP
jgi:hypothetical protein